MPSELQKKDRHPSLGGQARRTASTSAETDGLNQRERELRRARGEIACAECKRLKLKCDRTVPCSSCVRRGRPSICPNGVSGASHHEDKGPFPDFVQVRHKLKEMSDRIRQLEDALEILQKTNSDAPHPLLQKLLLKVKQIDDVSDMPNTKKDTSSQLDESDLDEIGLSIGMLTISESGISSFLGRGGGAESLILRDVSSNGDDDQQEVPFEVGRLVKAMVFIDSGSTEEYLNAVMMHLPSWERASSLCEIYFEHCSWITRPITRDQLINEVLPSVYKRGNYSAKRAARADEVAILFSVFALGALADLTLPPYNEEAETYYQLGRATAVSQTLFENPSLASIQAIMLMAAYIALSNRYYAIDATSSLISMGCSLAKSMGLHRDPAQWQLDPKAIDRRRLVFWELFLFDNLQAFFTGRPPNLSLRYCDTEFPVDTDQHVDSDGNVSPSFWRWKFQNAKKVMYPLNEILTNIGPTKYADILKVDSEADVMLIIPPQLKIPPGGSSWENDSPSLIMSRLLSSMSRDLFVVHVHRSFFARALLDHPNDPLKSPYAHSFLTAYNSAVSILKSIRIHYDICPALISRFWSIWTHAFSATVILGSTVIRAPTLELTPTAVLEFGYAIDLFQKALTTSSRAKRAMSVLLGLRDKVYKAYSRSRYGTGSAGTNPTQKDWENELSILAGNTHFIAKKDNFQHIVKPQNSSPSKSITESPSSSPLPSEATQVATPYIPAGSSFQSYEAHAARVDAEYSYLATLAEAQSDLPYRLDQNPSWLDRFRAGPSSSDQNLNPPPFTSPTPQQQVFSQLTNPSYPSTSYQTNQHFPDSNESQLRHIFPSNATSLNGVTYPLSGLNMHLSAGQAPTDEAWTSLMQDSNMMTVMNL